MQENNSILALAHFDLIISETLKYTQQELLYS